MSDTSIGPPSGDEELFALAAEHRRTYNMAADTVDEWLEHRREIRGDIRVVRRNGKVAGGLTLIPMGQWFGGRSVPMTGIGSVGIDPAERATGLASALMRSVVEELHANGTALSALYPATQPVYRRVGYELAGSWINYAVEANAIDVRDRTLAIERFDPVDRDVVEPLYAERARRTNANLDRSDRFWKRVLDNEKGDLHTYVVTAESGPEGYVAFTQSGSWKYDLNLRDVVALTPSAARRLWTFFADHRSFAGKVKWTGGPADPFTYHLREQEWSVDRAWNWMLRIVDVERALVERGYPASLDTELHLNVSDDVMPANNGSFILRVAGGKGDMSRGGLGSVKIDVRGLASLYSGFLSAEELKATGYIEGPDEDLAIATAIFGGPAPWLADFF